MMAEASDEEHGPLTVVTHAMAGTRIRFQTSKPNTKSRYSPLPMRA